MNYTRKGKNNPKNLNENMQTTMTSKHPILGLACPQAIIEIITQVQCQNNRLNLE